MARLRTLRWDYRRTVSSEMQLTTGVDTVVD